MNDPGIFSDGKTVEDVDQNDETIDRDWHLNKPVSLSRKKRRRKPEDEFERRGLDGGKPTKRQNTSLSARRRWQEAIDHDEAPDLKRCLGGSALLQICNTRDPRFSCYRPPQLCARRGDTRDKLTPTDWLAVELVIGAQLNEHAQALMVRYDDLVPLLNCDYDTVGKIMRKLVRVRIDGLPLVQYLPVHRCIGSRNYRTKTRQRALRASNVYWVDTRVLEKLRITQLPRVAPPPAPGLREAQAIVERTIASAQKHGRMNCDQRARRLDRTGQQKRLFDPRNPDPSEYQSFRDNPDLPGDPETMAVEGAPAAPAGEFFVSRPDESHLPSGLQGVKPRTADLASLGLPPPLKAPREGVDALDPSVADERVSSSEAIDSPVDKATVATLVERAEAKGRRAGIRQARAFYDNELATVRRETAAKLHSALGETARRRGRADAPPPPTGDALDDLRRAQRHELEQGAKYGVITGDQLALLDKLRALEEREAELDEGAAPADADENGGAE